MSLPIYYEIPPVVEGAEILRGSFAVIVPEATQNLISNPSFELNLDGYGSQFIFTTLTRTITQQKRGAFSLQVENDDGGYRDFVYYSIDLVSGVTYTFSLDILAYRGNFNLYFADSSDNIVSGVKKFVATGFWDRQWITYTCPSNANYHLTIEVDPGFGASFTYYTDGWQLEAKTYPTTYADGDMTGFIPGEQAYYWSGFPHKSMSSRSSTTRTGGQEIFLSDYGFKLMALMGLSMPPVNNIATPSILGGSYYQRTLAAPQRDFSLAGTLTGNRHDIDRAKKELINILAFDRSPDQPLILRYHPTDDCGEISNEAWDIPCLYKAGLEGAITNYHQERVAIQFSSFTPYILLDGNRAADLEISQRLDVNFLAERNNNGVWDGMAGGTGTSVSETVYETKYNPHDGLIYVYGSFDIVGGVSANCIATWNGTTYAPLGVGVSYASIVPPSITSIDFDSNGYVFVVGLFDGAGGSPAYGGAYWDGFAWHDIGLPAGFVSDAPPIFPSTIAIDARDFVYIGGNFSDINGVTGTKGAGVWNRTTWLCVEATNTGADDAVNIIKIGSDGTVYFTGDFANFGGVAAQRICMLPLSTSAGDVLPPHIIRPMGVGADDRVYAIEILPDGSVLAGGVFHTIGTVSANNIISGAITVYQTLIGYWSGTDWSLFATFGSESPLGAAIIKAIKYNNGEIWAGGEFNLVNSKKINFPLAYFVSGVWFPSGLEPHDASVINITGIEFSPDRMVIVEYDNGYLTTEKQVIIDNDGATTRPVFKFKGPGTLEFVKSYTSGKILAFSGLDLLYNEIATIDLRRGQFDIYSNRRDLKPYVVPGSNYDFDILPGKNIISALVSGTTIIEITDTYNQLSGYTEITGINSNNSDNGIIYVNIYLTGYQVWFYRDSARSIPVGSITWGSNGRLAITPDSDYPIGGYITVDFTNNDSTIKFAKSWGYIIYTPTRWQLSDE